MNRETERKLVLWLSFHPESDHQLDRFRMYDFVREAGSHEDDITDSILKSMVIAAKPTWSEDMVNTFVEEYSIKIEQLLEFYDFCVESPIVEDEDNVNRLNVNSIEEFMQEIGDLNYHELYELVMAINGQNAALNFFSVEDKGEERTVVYDVMDVAFEFKISDAEVFTAWIEDRYMEGLDADSWYGFKDALERSKNY